MNKGSLNRAVLIGRLGRDPQVRYTPTGTPITSFSVATTQVFKNKEGKLVQNTDWHRVVAWSRLAEVCGQYLKKGSLVCVEGPMKTRRWDDKSGGKHALTEVVAETMQMLGSRSSKQNVHDDDASDETGIETHDDVAEIVSENEYSEHTVVRTDEVPF